jgi:hypothetical protein
MPITYNETGVTYDATGYTYNGDPFAPSVFPVAGVYIAFDDGPYTASPAWTEITTYVRSITVRRGRADDFEQFDTGTAQLVLDNRERRFDPFYTSGPYYLKLTPRRQIRIVGQIGGSTYEVFRGYVAGWPVEWSEAGYDSTVTIQAFDALGLMANETLPTDWPAYYTTSLAPRHYYQLNDGRSATYLLDQNKTGAPNLNIPDPTPILKWFDAPPMGRATIGNSLAFIRGVGASANSATVTPDLSISFWYKPIFDNTGSGADIRWGYGQCSILFAQSTTAATIEVRNGTNLRNYSYTATSTDPVYLTLVMSANGTGNPTLALYVNAQSVTPTIVSTSAAGRSPLENVSILGAQCQEFAVFDYALTAAQVATLYNANAQNFVETTSARMQRLSDTTDFPAALESFTASPAATVAEIGTGTGVIPEMQLVADSEGGEIYVSKAGVLTTTNRTDVFNATRSVNVQATITDSGVGIRYGTDVSIEYDGDNLKNDITVTFSGDGEVNAYSDAVISAYGGSSTTIETQLADPTSAAQLALVELGVEGSLVPRISPIDVSPNTAAADWQTILGLELLDRVTFKRTPSVGNQFSRDALINAIDHQIEPGVWRTQLTLSMRYTSPLTLDDDVLGTLDFNYLG